jgi:hypothetical protein
MNAAALCGSSRMIQEMFLVKRFNRRIYPSVSAFIADLKAIMHSAIK